MNLHEIKNDFRIHKELAPSQITWLVDRVEQLEDALKKCDPSIHPVFVCNKIRKEALEEP